MAWVIGEDGLARARHRDDREPAPSAAAGPTRALRLLADPAPKGYIYPCTVGDLKRQLRRVPPEYLDGLWQIRLSNQVRRYRDRDGDYLDGEIRLFPYPERLIFPASPKPNDPWDQEWLAWGARIVDDAGVRSLQWTPEALRRFILDHVLLHELGHHYAARRGLPDSERSAERLAREIRARLAPADA
jgi:hypothetical protein